MDTLRWAAVLPGIGLLDALLLVKRADMKRQDAPPAEDEMM